MMKPTNELETIFKFAKMLPKDWDVLELQHTFPDAKILIAGEVYLVEFEFVSSSFATHEHDIMGCDVIICWEDDWGDKCPLPVIALSEEGWQNTPVGVGLNLEKALRYERMLRKKLEEKIIKAEKKVGELKRSIASVDSSQSEDFEYMPCDYCGAPLKVGPDGTTKRAWAGHVRACPSYKGQSTRGSDESMQEGDF